MVVILPISGQCFSGSNGARTEYEWHHDIGRLSEIVADGYDHCFEATNWSTALDRK
ncbi:hypothetical protein Agau_P200318 (plasmid) [Agrobacterium tumefaciens F2]|nr:hypothetical protein Agau_P200318 [Agrobacterium tumefaciens F2]